MPRIKLSDGTYYYYKTKPIFLGVKQMNKEISFENLRILKDVLDKRGVEFQITFGTLLGAIREKDFIAHDEDIDLQIMEEDKLRFFDTLPELRKFGFEVARYDRRGLLSIYRKGEYIDFYFYRNRGDGTRYCSGYIFPCEIIEQSMNYEFKGLDVKIPVEYIKFLIYTYGDGWQKPVVWNNYEMSRLKRTLLSVKSVVKEWLPDRLYMLMARPSELRLINKYEKKLAKYREGYYC